ncbi:MAG TPA: ABC transporter permease [Vicinamibacterales bacterium]|nr:ABC transporter permease [Vicinamibacterales bacterium]
MRDDLKAAFRSLKSSKTFTAVALTVLALGIGASTAIFSVVDAVVLRGLPFDEHDRLVAVGERRPPGPRPDPSRDPNALSSAAPQNYLDWAARQQVFESIAAIAGASFTLREPGSEPEDLRGQRVTASFFDVLRAGPAIGRPFALENETDGQHRVVVLSDGFWRRRFGGDPAVLGRTIPLEGGLYEVLGVMPPEFQYPVGAVRPTDIWVPYVVPQDERTRNLNFRSIYLQTIARLKPGVSLEQAQAQMDQIAAALREEHPVWNKDNLVGVRPLRDHLVGASTRSWMLMLLGAVAIVLLIACANVANLLLARATGREREIGIRAALGAGRWRLVRQLLVESLVLSTIGTILAVVLAWWAVQVLKTSMPEGVPRVAAIALDLRVLGAAAVLSVLTGLLFGIFPALQLSRPDLTNALKDGSRGAGVSGARQTVRSLLVVAEVALAVVLLVGAALFIGSFVALMRIDPGFDPKGVLTLSVSPRIQTGASRGAAPNHTPAFEQIVDRVSRHPGVVQAAVISGGMPLGGSMSITSMTVPGRPSERGEDDGISIRRVTAAYHHAMRIPLRQGRYFEATDREGAPPVVIINESAAKKYFPGEDPVGRSVRLSDEERTVVGVVGDVYQSSLETEPRTEAYVPMAQSRAPFGELIIRTTGDPYDVLPAVKAAVLQVLPEVPIRNVRTLEELIATRVAQRRLNMLLLGGFGLLGLVISAVGIYGVMAYTVSQRTREIGVRMALGATRGAVVSMVMRQATMLLVAGLVVGGAGAWYLSRGAERFLFRLESHDPRAFTAALVTLAAAALIASLIPACRAASIDPMEALRGE